MWKEGCTVLPPQADGFASTRPEQCWKPEALLVLPNSLSICFPWREHPGMVAVSPPGSCATKRGSLRLWILPQCFSREASGGLGEELGSGNKPPCVWGPQLFYTDILVNAYSVLGIFFFLFISSSPLYGSCLFLSHTVKGKTICVLTLLGGIFLLFEIQFPLAMWPQPSDEFREVMILYTVQHFLVRMGVTVSWFSTSQAGAEFPVYY